MSRLRSVATAGPDTSVSERMSVGKVENIRRKPAAGCGCSVGCVCVFVACAVRCACVCGAHFPPRFSALVPSPLHPSGHHFSPTSLPFLAPPLPPIIVPCSFYTLSLDEGSLRFCFSSYQQETWLFRLFSLSPSPPRCWVLAASPLAPRRRATFSW